MSTEVDATPTDTVPASRHRARPGIPRFIRVFAVPIMEAMGLYMVPLMVGTRNVSFPRMNATGYILFLAGGVLLFGGLFMNVGADRGWFSYVPLSGPQYAAGKRSDFWNQMITLTEIAALIGSAIGVTSGDGRSLRSTRWT